VKHKALHTIYDIFDKWSSAASDLRPSCHKGCSACCTQNVTITALEAEDILRYIIAEKKVDWFAQKLQIKTPLTSPKLTTNDFAQACLNGQDVDPQPQISLTACPFLEENICRIYPARPFSCRLFVSSSECTPSQPALVPDWYVEGSTAISQLIEHLGQKEYWGNMLDVLPALLDIREFHEISENFDQITIISARLKTLTAKPLPGFLISDQGGDRVAALVEEIFTTEVEGKNLEDYLNGR
jgi:Fe-S-cluster containining protein